MICAKGRIGAVLSCITVAQSAEQSCWVVSVRASLCLHLLGFFPCVLFIGPEKEKVLVF